MEYEKQINRLVLGYLKNECKSAYKIFLKSHFQNHHKHIATRVAGQTLEDILHIYSKVQDIVQGRLEDTDYYKENGTEFSSPIYLPEQLLYLLDKGRPYTPVSSSCNRSPAASSFAETYHGNNDIIDCTSDVETTPEHSLPGNMHNDDNNHLKTPFRRKSPVFRTPYLEKLPNSEHENISSVMSMKLLEKTEFHEKLAQNITTALNTPELSSSLRKRESEADKKGFGAELEDTIIKNALNRTEADPMFEDLLQDFLDPIANTIGKAIASETAPTSNSSTTTATSDTPSHMEDQNRGAISSMLALSNANTANMHYKSANSDAGSSTDNGREPKMSTEPLGTCTIGTSDHVQGHVQPKNAENPQIIYPPTVPTASMIQTTSQQQQFYIVNQPLVIPQPLSIFQPMPAAANNSKSSKKTLPKPNVPLTEQDILSMPTIILNDRNEITYADPASLIATTPYKLNEVHNIKEYLNAFGATDQSPIIKKPTKKSQSFIKPTPTIKVEVFQRNSPLTTVNDDQVVSSGNSSNPTKELPNLNDTDLCKEVPTYTDKDISKATSDDSEKQLKSLGILCTPSPVVTTTRKPTPKSSGSHVRNLTFPSPIRKSDEKPDASRKSPTVLNKQQATKDLFNNKSEDETQKINSSPKKKGRSRDKKESKSPTKKSTPPSKLARTESPKPVTKPLKKTSNKDNNKQTNKIIDHKTPKSWDAALRKNLTTVNDENQSTPKRTTSRRRSKRPTESDITEADGKKLEEALKTPIKSEKPKRKAPATKKNAKVTKPASEKLPRVEQETSVEPKKVLSPSKLCNTASKRNMEVDGITPNNTKATSNQPLLNARKNINSLLETPLKDDGTPSTTENISDPSNNTPFTPMLKANLKGFTVGDTFSIDTPDFPVTPGLALMEHSSAAYCMLNDTETNKVTEAIVLSEERKSSVRKTDDEDFELSPKVYGCKVILDDFNKNRTGKKNLELLDSKGVSWDGSSDREDKSDNSGSSSDEETNSTVIQKSEENAVSAAPRSVRTAGKSMATLKSRLLEKTKNGDDSFDASSLEHGNIAANSDADKEEPVNVDDNPPKLNKPKNTGNHKESDTVSDKKYKSRLGKNYVEEETKENKNNTTNEDDKNKRSCKGREKPSASKIEAAKDQSPKVASRRTESKQNSDATTTLTSVTVDVIKEAVSSVPENCCTQITSAFSLKTEMDEKRRRMIELEKASQAPKTPGRRKSQSDQTSLRNKRKRAAPRKSVPEEHNEVVASDFGKVDSQDEFFKKSGTNLHRTNKQQVAESMSETSCNEDAKKEEAKAERGGSSERNIGELPTRPKQSDEDKKTIDDTTVNDNADASWDTYIMELQPEAKVVVYDEQHTSKKSLKDYDFSLVKKQLHVMIPLENGSSQPVLIQATPYKLLFELEPSTRRATPDCSSDSENVGPKVVDHEEHKGAKKRKNRSDSCNSDSSSKKMKTSSLPRNCLNENNIAMLLTKLHGPSDKT